MARFDTTLEAAGAEHLVIGRLLIERIQAFRAYANQPGHDLIAVSPSSGRSLKIQVKSRVAVDSGAFKIGNFDFDFVVFVRLNRGTKASLKAGAPDEVRLPQFFVVPRSVIESRYAEPPARVTVGDIQNYLEDWLAISRALQHERQLEE